MGSSEAYVGDYSASRKMSSKISDKASDVKGTGSSDSDDDDDTSSSSLLSSSAPSEDESDVETVTFSVPLPSQGKGGKPAELEKESPANDSRKFEQEQNKAVKTEKSGGASRSSLSPNKPEVAVSGTSKVLSGASGLKRPDEPKVTMATTANTQRSISPKIVVNDVETADAKTDAKRSAETSIKIRGNSPKKTVSETSNADPSCLESPAKNVNHGDRSKSPQKAESKVEMESPKSVKKNASVISALDAGQKSPRVSPSRRTSEELGGGSSKSSQGEKEAERSKSPKKNSEEGDISREKSLKKTSIIDSKEALGETSTRNSSKETVPGQATKKSDKEATKTSEDLIRTEKSPSGNTKTKLETNQENPETEEAKAKPKKTKTPKQDDGDVKDDNTSTKSIVDRTQIEDRSMNVDIVSQNKGKTSLLYNGLVQDFNKESKRGLQKRESNSERLDKESAYNISDNVGVRKTKSSELSKPVESENDIINQTPVDAASLGQKTSKKAESGSDGVGNDTSSSSSSSSSSKSHNDLKTTENTKELVNEDSEFTYRRKSMDDFIKRILAEAREEKLKQQKGVKDESTAAAAGVEEEEDRKTERYKEQNGDIFNETPGLPPKWSHGAATDKEASNLDKRLANIEKRRFNDNESVKGGRSKVKEEGGEEEESAVKKKPLQNDVNGIL